MKKKVLIVNPGLSSGYQRLRFGRIVPYSLPLLASILKEIGWQSRILDANLEPLVFGNEPVVFITGQTAQAKAMEKVAQLAKTKGKIIVCGGIHASMCPKEVSRWSDVVFRGEAEGRLSEIMVAIERGRHQKIYDFFGKHPNLDQMPIPVHDQVPPYSRVFIRSLQTTRGCPYNCDICSVTAFSGHRLRHRRLQDIEVELKLLKGLKTKMLFLLDDDAFEDPRYSEELIKLLGRFRFHITAQTRATLATRKTKLLAKAAKVGFSLAFVGFERMSDEGLNQMGKGTSVKENKEAIRVFHRFGVAVMGSMIFGYPEDTTQTAETMINFFCQEKIEVPQVSLLTPFPGTLLREKMLKAGWILPGGWEKYNAITPLVKSRQFSPVQQAKAFWQIYQKVYSLNNIFKRLFLALLRLGFLEWLMILWLNLDFRKGSRAEAKARGFP